LLGDDDADVDADVDVEVQRKFSVPLVPQCSVMTEQEKRLQVVVFKGVFLFYMYLFLCTSRYHTLTEIFYRLTVLTS
jgi:hypothetical protein